MAQCHYVIEAEACFGTVPPGYTLAQCHYDIEVCIGIVPLEIFLEAGIGRVPLSEYSTSGRESLTMLKPNIIATAKE